MTIITSYHHEFVYKAVPCEVIGDASGFFGQSSLNGKQLYAFKKGVTKFQHRASAIKAIKGEVRRHLR